MKKLIKEVELFNFTDFIEDFKELSEHKIEKGESWTDSMRRQAIEFFEAYDCKSLDEYKEMISEWAGGQVDIYYSDLYKNCSLFADWATKADEEGLVSAGSISDMLEAGQFHAYRTFINKVIDKLEN